MHTSISVSQMGTFQDCNYKWQLMYKEGIRIRKGQLTPSSIGSVFHEGIAAALKTMYKLQNNTRMKDVTKLTKMLQSASQAIKVWDTENYVEQSTSVLNADGDLVIITDDTFVEDWQLMLHNGYTLVERTLSNLDILHRYRVASATVNGKKNTPLVELWLETDLSLALGFPPDMFAFAGVVDAVLINQETGITEVVDWKLHKRFTSLEDEQLSSQIALYQHALRILYGINAPVGVVYQIKRDPPRKPSQNLDGSMSRRKITSDWPTYQDALIEAGLNPLDYVDEMQPKLADSEFFRPLMVFRNENITQIFWDNMITFARHIIKTDKFPMALGYSCQTCPFKALCTARIYGYDEEALFEDKYIRKEEIEVIVDEELEDIIGD